MWRETVVLEANLRANAKASPGTRRLVLVVLSGGQVGQRFVLERSHLTIGRGVENDIQLEDEGISRHHATIDLLEGRCVLLDEASTNGLFVNGSRCASSDLEPGDKIGIGADTVLRFHLEDDLDDELERTIFTAARLDGLTGAFNRGAFDRELESEVARANRHGTALSLLLFDLDHFKNVNDTHGHAVGDTVLREFAGRIQAVTRSEDYFARFGGEEFAMICSGTTTEEALQLAERALLVVTAEPFGADGRSLAISASIGIAELEAAAERTPRALVEAADAALYRAKQAGRARVEV